MRGISFDYAPHFVSVKKSQNFTKCEKILKVCLHSSWAVLRSIWRKNSKIKSFADFNQIFIKSSPSETFWHTLYFGHFLARKFRQDDFQTSLIFDDNIETFEFWRCRNDFACAIITLFSITLGKKYLLRFFSVLQG